MAGFITPIAQLIDKFIEKHPMDIMDIFMTIIQLLSQTITKGIQHHRTIIYVPYEQQRAANSVIPSDMCHIGCGFMR